MDYLFPKEGEMWSPEMNSICFICGGFIHDHSVNDLAQSNLKELLAKICKLLRVGDVHPSEWDFLTVSVQRKHICCKNCWTLLMNVDRVHEIIVNAERELKSYLDQVETLVVKSEAQCIDGSGWAEGCIKFRKHIAERAITIQSEENITVDNFVKEEEEEEPDSLLNTEYVPLYDTFVQDNWDNHVVTNSEDVAADDTRNYHIENVVFNPGITINIIPPREAQRIETLPQEYVNCDESTSVSLFTLDKYDEPPSKRRKVIVIAEEDEAKDLNVGRRTVGRVAKQNAEKVLKNYISTSFQSEDEDGPTGNVADDDNDYVDGDDKNLFSDDNEDSNCSDKKVSKTKCKPASTKCPEERTNSNISNSEASSENATKRRKGEGKWVHPKVMWLPLIVADENLYVYKYSTFIRKTNTHLQCQAHQCTFKTEFDYYPSFQIMRQHVEENHRSRKHRQRFPHPCGLCNTMYPNQFHLREHFKAAHEDKLTHRVAQAICECCLMYTRNTHARFHVFTHKNEEEKAFARQIGDGNTRCFLPKEKDIIEKKFACDWEGCTSSFKSKSNWNRHRRTHLPLEERTDVTICPDCGERILKEGFTKHMIRRHHPEMVARTLVCPICEKRFISSDNAKFQHHMRIHRGEKTFLCTQCGAVFASNAGLTAHVKQVHDNIGPTPCEWCGKIYTKKRSLVGHWTRRHPDKFKPNPSFKFMSKFYYNEELEKARKMKFIGPVQKFPCPVCSIICTYRHSLKRHMLKHSDGNHDIGRKRKRKVKNDDIVAGALTQQEDSSDSEEDEHNEEFSTN